jgi:hypothetical protein
MFHDYRSRLPTRRSFIQGIVRLGGAGIAVAALTESNLAQRPVYAQQGGNNQGGNNQGGNRGAPEIDAGAAVSALVLLSGGALMLADRFRRGNRTA